MELTPEVYYAVESFINSKTSSPDSLFRLGIYALGGATLGSLALTSTIVGIYYAKAGFQAFNQWYSGDDPKYPDMVDTRSFKEVLDEKLNDLSSRIKN